MKKVKIQNVAIEDPLHKRLRRASDETGIRIKAIVRQALEAWLKELDDKRKAA